MYTVYDDILPKEMVDQICDYVTSPSFEWYCGTCGRTLDDKFSSKYPNFQNSVQLTHAFLSRSQKWYNGGINGYYGRNYDLAVTEREMINRLLKEFYKHIGELPINKVIHRIKANLLVQSVDDTPNPPHIDIIDGKHKVFLMYMNDSDGDTLFYKDETGEEIINRISPKRGRIVFFDGHHYHSSTPPVKSSKRMVINIDIMNEEDVIYE